MVKFSTAGTAVELSTEYFSIDKRSIRLAAKPSADGGTWPLQLEITSSLVSCRARTANVTKPRRRPNRASGYQPCRCSSKKRRYGKVRIIERGSIAQDIGGNRKLLEMP